MRLVLVPLAALALAAGAPADPPAAPHPPFDLTYLPRGAGDAQALYALRPAALAAHPDLAPAAAWLDAAGGHLLDVIGGDGAGPGFAGLDQLLLCGHVTIGTNTDPATAADKPATFLAGVSGFAARTARPFDWAAAAARWFPKGEVRRHAGREYRTARIDLGKFLPGFPIEPFEVGVYAAPDGRTVVADTADAIRAVIDRAGRPATPPPGWGRVDRATVAAAIENRDKRWVRYLPDHFGPTLPDPANRLFLAADHFALGLECGPTTTLRAVAVCRDPFQAKHARYGRGETFARLADHFAPLAADTPSPEWAALGKLTDALLKDGTTTATPLGFEYAGTAPGDLLGALARLAAR